MKVEIALTADDIESLKLLVRHFPLWFREDSDGVGTHERRSMAVLKQLVSTPIPAFKGKPGPAWA